MPWHLVPHSLLSSYFVLYMRLGRYFLLTLTTELCPISTRSSCLLPFLMVSSSNDFIWLSLWIVCSEIKYFANISLNGLRLCASYLHTCILSTHISFCHLYSPRSGHSHTTLRSPPLSSPPLSMFTSYVLSRALYPLSHSLYSPPMFSPRLSILSHLLCPLQDSLYPL